MLPMSDLMDIAVELGLGDDRVRRRPPLRMPNKGSKKTKAIMAMTPTMAISQRSCLRKNAKGLAMRNILTNRGPRSSKKP